MAASKKVKRTRKSSKGAPKRKAEPTPELGYTAEKVNTTMFPVGTKVQLGDGTTVEVLPWSIKTFGLMAQRIPALLDKAGELDEDSAVGFSGLVTDFLDEILFMVGETMDMTADEIHETMTFDDLLLVTTAIWDECVSGPMTKIAGLTGRVVGTAAPLATLKTKTPQPSSSPLSS